MGSEMCIRDSNSTKVIIDALSELTDVRVVSSPQLLVMDGGTARLHVGDQVPIVKRSSATTAADNDRIVNVKLHGACVGCSVNQMTLKTGVEMTIKKYVPQIDRVVGVEDQD